MTDIKRRVLIINDDPYFRRKPINVRDEDGVFTYSTRPWTTHEEFERACDLVDAFQKKTPRQGFWTARYYFDMLAWGETVEAHRAIASDLLTAAEPVATSEPAP